MLICCWPERVVCAGGITSWREQTHDTRLISFADRIIFIEDGRPVREEIGSGGGPILLTATGGH